MLIISVIYVCAKIRFKQMKLHKMFKYLLVVSALVPTISYAQNWANIGTVGTMNNNELCYTDGADIICDAGLFVNGTEALEVSGTVSATAFIGDGSGLTGVAATSVTIGLNDLTDALHQQGDDGFLYLGVNAGITDADTTSRNTAVGNNALKVVNGGTNNLAIGNGTMQNTTTGRDNVAVGARALLSNVGGSSNVSIGRVAMYYASEGNDNVAIGRGAGYGVTGSSDFNFNTLVGSRTGVNLQTGADGNVLIGYYAGNDITTGTGNIVIGSSATTLTPTKNDMLNIGNVFMVDMNGSSGLSPAPSYLGDGAVAIGPDAEARFDGNIAIGDGSRARSSGSVAIGEGSSATNNFTTAVGGSSSAGSVAGTAFGYSANAGKRGTAAGYNSRSDEAGTVLGHSARILNSTNNGIAIGSNSSLDNASHFSVAIGSDSYINAAENALAIGASSTVTADNAGLVNLTGAPYTLATSNTFEIAGATVSATAFVGDGSGLTNLPGGLWTDAGDYIVRDGFRVYVSGTTIDLNNNDILAFFDKEKGAFRSGRVNYNDWDDANIGNYSTAFGRATASGGTSFAWGAASGSGNTVAAGSGDLALGFGAKTNSSNSWKMAIGVNAEATSSPGNTAFGPGAKALGGTGYYAAFAVGPGAVAESGEQVFALGYNAKANTGFRNIAVGHGVETSGSRSSVFGYGGTVSGDDAMLLAVGADASGTEVTNSNTLAIMGATNGVGIGTVSPLADLHVHKDTGSVGTIISGAATENQFLSFAAATDNAWDISRLSSMDAGMPNGLVIGGDHSGVGGTSFASLSLDVDGNVGVAGIVPAVALDVSGTLMISNGGEVCDASTEGAIRYTPAGGVMYCDASAWSSMGGIPDSIVSNDTSVSIVDSGTGEIHLDADGVRTITVSEGSVDISASAKVAGTGSEVCGAASDLGRMRWNPVTQKFQICRQ